MRKSLTLLLLSVSLLCSAQQNRDHNARFTIRGNVGIPRAISSQMFQKAFSAIYETNLSLNLRLFDNVFMGIGYQNTFFRASAKVRQIYSPQASLPYDTGLQGNAGFIKIGYDRFFKEKPDKGYVSYSINAGMMYLGYSDVVNDTLPENRPYVAQKFNAPYIQPEVSVNFKAEGHLAFSVMLSYTTLLAKFDPKAPRFNSLSLVNTMHNRYFMSWFSFGFGVHVLIGK